MISAQRKRRLVSLVRNGKPVTQACAQVGVSRTTAWKWLKEAKAESPEPAAAPQPQESHRDLEAREELERVLPADMLEALYVPDEPEAPAHAKINDGLPAVVVKAGDREEPSGGFGAKAIPEGHPAGTRKTYMPGRDRSFAHGLNPSASDLGPDPDIVGHTQRHDAPGGAPRRPVRPIDPRESYAGVLRRKRGRGTQSQQGFTPPMVVGGR